MLKTYLYVPDEIDQAVVRLAKKTKKSKAEVLRNALSEGIKQMKAKDDNSASVLRKIGEIGKKYKAKGPKDLSSNLDKYLWDNYEL